MSDKSSREFPRREFLHGCLLAGSTVLSLNGATPGNFAIESLPDASFHRRLSERELQRGIASLRLSGEVKFIGRGERPAEGDLFLRFEITRNAFRSPEAYLISRNGREVVFRAGTETGLLYSVFDFLEHQGAYFGVDGESYPLDTENSLVLPGQNQPWQASPRFEVRGLLPWPDFLNCITVFNDEDFRAYFESMLRMRFNTFGMHVYSSPESTSAGTESFLSFEFAGVSHRAFLDNSASERWGYLPQRTSRYGMGGSQFFSGEVFGADATIQSRNPFEIAERTRQTLAHALSYAKKLGIATGIGFEPYQIPDAMLRALPPEVKPKPKKPFPGKALFDVESPVARRLLEARLAELLEAYPDVDYVWLWEDEGMNWESRKTGVPLSVTPFRQAYDFLKRNAPKKRMVLSGWGGVVRHFEYFHQKLPQDVVFSCLNDSLGWDPVSEIFGKLEGRERWPIPWLEDDPGMWLPQFHVNRTRRDVDLASKLGCQGILGIHWRHRIMDTTAGYLAKSTWNNAVTPASHFAVYAKSQASGNRATELGALLNDTDLHQKLLHTGTNQVRDGHVVTREWSGDYSEGFVYWNDYEPDPQTVESQKQVAEKLQKLTDAANSAAERERLGYLAGFVNFAVPYTDAWTTAHRLNTVLADAEKLKSAGHAGEAKQRVMNEGVPLWLTLAPLVRETMIRYQNIVATRNGLGQLASMHNKFVRLALFRLPLSIEHYTDELPASVTDLFEKVMAEDRDSPARIFLPTRPGMLGPGERFRLTIVITGHGSVDGVTLNTRLHGAAQWTPSPARHAGRRTYEATVGPWETGKTLAAYYVSANVAGKTLVAPSTFPGLPHFVTLV